MLSVHFNRQRHRQRIFKIFRDGRVFAKKHFPGAECSLKHVLLFFFLNVHNQIKILNFKTHYKHTHGPKSKHQKLLFLAWLKKIPDTQPAVKKNPSKSRTKLRKTSHQSRWYSHAWAPLTAL